MSSVRNGSVTVSADLMRSTCPPLADAIASHRHGRHELRPIEAVARERFLGGEFHVERGEIFGRRVNEFDLGIERRVERRIQMNVTEPQRVRDSGQQQKRQQTPGETNTQHSRLHIHRRL